MAEVQKLRIKDVDVKGGKLEVRGWNGDKDRVLALPKSLQSLIEEHLGRVRADREDDGTPRSAERAYGRGRHHIHDIRIDREIRRVVKLVGLGKRVTAHTLRHTFATHLIVRGVDIRSVQQLRGHADVRTTEIYTELAKAMRGEIASLLDDL